MNPFRSLFNAAQSGGPQQSNAAANVGDAAARSPRDAVMDLLKLEGCNPRVDGDGDVVFRYKEFNYVLIFSRKDPEFVRLLLPNFYSIDSESERRCAHAAANLTNATCKAAKVYIERNQTHAAVECFLAAPEQIVAVLLRSASALEYAAKTFVVACSMQGDR